MTCKFVVGGTYVRNYDLEGCTFKCLALTKEFAIVYSKDYTREIAIHIDNGVTAWQQVTPPHEYYFCTFEDGTAGVFLNTSLSRLLEAYDKNKMIEVCRLVSPIDKTPYVEVLKDAEWK